MIERENGWLLPLLDLFGKSIAEGEPEHDPQTTAAIELTNRYNAAVARLQSADYEPFYENTRAKSAPNLYVEAFFDGLEAGLKAAGVIVKIAEEQENGQRKTAIPQVPPCKPL